MTIDTPIYTGGPYHHSTVVYRTIREARSQAALDAGFDRWNYRRITTRDLQAAGYTVDPKEWRRRKRLEAAEREKLTAEPRYRFECDNGHRWTATDAEDRAADHKCPTCGEYWE